MVYWQVGPWSVLDFGEPEEDHDGDEGGGPVDHVPLVFGASPVVGVLVVPVVVSFAVGDEGHEIVVSGFDVGVPFSGAEHVADRVDTPSGVQRVAVEGEGEQDCGNDWND